MIHKNIFKWHQSIHKNIFILKTKVLINNVKKNLILLYTNLKNTESKGLLFHRPSPVIWFFKA